MKYIPKPEWLRRNIFSESGFASVNSKIRENGLNTICTSGRCPNISECWSKGTATLMILGDICTRTCKFCNTKSGRPFPPDPLEPQKVAETIKDLKLRHAVLTSVDRDDLPDRGASLWAQTIREVRLQNPGITLEVLIPDFDGKEELINIIIQEKPDVISHNLETVKRLTPGIRSKAKYEISLKVLAQIASSGITSKTGIMLGLGETEAEIFELMDDALAQGCSVITIGQYLQPSRKHIPVSAYIHPDKFLEYKTIALQKGFRIAESGPFVRSSYCAEKHL
jgi:lipoic acid synthetase